MSLHDGMVIPAHPLALTAQRTLDERHQRALTRYYLDSGAGGIAVGVHTTQFAIRDPRYGLYRPVLELAAETCAEWESQNSQSILRIAGVIGMQAQAAAEARLAHDCGYHVALLGLGALQHASDDELIAHVRAVSDIMPVMGFYLQPAVGGRTLSYAFWRRLAEIERVVAIKIAPFNRYQTLDVVRAIADSGRARDIALYTGNDDAILVDLLTTWSVASIADQRTLRLRMVGGLLGHWAYWTRSAVGLHASVRALEPGDPIPSALLTLAAQITDANGAIFDAANGFHGCIPGIHEILRRQGLLAGRWCLDPAEELSPGQAAEIDRISHSYPMMHDDAFVRENLDRWLK